MTRIVSSHPRGFTLFEVLVSLFIFTIVMTATTQIFATAYSGYRMTRLVQRDIENAQFAMNTLAKTLRTSTVVSTAGNQSSVKFFDYSQDVQGRCFLYRINGGALEVASGVASDVSACSALSLSTFTVVTTGTVTGSFQITLTTPTSQVGKVTIALVVGENTGVHSARLQTTVSLRDYGYAELL